MAASLEARMPFLDHRLIEFASSLPDRLRVQRTRTKVVLRQAMDGVLPGFVLHRSKVGFAMPIEVWLRRELKPLIGDALLGADSLCGRLMDRALLRGYLEAHMSGRRSHDKSLWMLLTLELWARHMRVAL
jgi:asparagine synthase (glutamine-hydrolysing)